MFVGHYGPGAAAASGGVRLWHCFLAVQLLDLLWAPFILTGVEHARIVPNFTASNHFDLYHMPVSHSLPMAALWSLAAGLVYRFVRPRAEMRGAIIIGLLVFSHWILDFVAHKPDLLLWFGGEKVGLGLWEDRPLSIAVELSLFLGGLTVFLLRTEPKWALGRVSPLLLLLAGIAAQIAANWGPPPASANEAAVTALVAYAIFALLALFVDVTRTAKGAQGLSAA